LVTGPPGRPPIWGPCGEEGRGGAFGLGESCFLRIRGDKRDVLACTKTPIPKGRKQRWAEEKHRK